MDAIASNAPQLRIAQIRKHVTIFEVLARFGIDLPEATQQIVCPFHPDTSPSARVYADQNKIFCFTEQKSWDVVDAAQQHFGFGLEEACSWLEAEFNVPGVTTSLQGTIRTQLASRVAPDIGATAAMIEQRLVEARARLGFEQYTRLLMALDVSVYEVAQKLVTPAQFIVRMTRLLQKVGS